MVDYKLWARKLVTLMVACFKNIYLEELSKSTHNSLMRAYFLIGIGIEDV
jgi:hypothetical protein